MSETDIDNEVISVNGKITWNKTNFLEVKKKEKVLNSLTTKDYNFSLGWIYFTSNDVFQKPFVINQHLTR